MTLTMRQVATSAPAAGQLSTSDSTRLTHLGVGPVEEAAYRVALDRPLWTLEDFALRLGMPGPRAAEVVRRLVELDLVRTNGNRLVPVNPQLALTALIARREA